MQNPTKYLDNRVQDDLSKAWIPPMLCALAFIMYEAIQPEILSISNTLFGRLSAADPMYIRSITIYLIFTWFSLQALLILLDGKRITGQSINISICSLIFYFFVLRADQRLHFFLFLDLDYVYVSDLITCSIILGTLSFRKNTTKDIPDSSILIEDPENISLENDKLNRVGLAKQLASLIINSYPQRSFGISIISPWGSGKSVFLNFVKENLKKNSDIILIDFNPWVNHENKSKTSLFFESLYNSMSNFNPRFADKIYRYSTDVLTSNADYSMPEKFVRAIINLLLPSYYTRNVDEQKDSINQSISELRKKIVVMIDDLDRLTSSEILELLSLIRNAADFRNTFFLVPIDLEYIRNSVHTSNSGIDVDQYLEKIFQLQISLQNIKIESISESVVSEMRNHLNSLTSLSRSSNTTIIKDIGDFMTKFEDAVLELRYTPNMEQLTVDYNSHNQKGILETSLTNIRDVKRFTNSFLLIANLLQGHFLIKELILLELVKLKYLDIYLKIIPGQLIEVDINQPGQWCLVNEYEEIINSQYPRNPLKANNCRILIEEIFQTYGGGDYDLAPGRDSIKFLRNYKKYFGHDLQGEPPLWKLKETIRSYNSSISDLAMIANDIKNFFEESLSGANVADKNSFRYVQIFQVERIFNFLIHEIRDIPPVVLAKCIKMVSIMVEYHFCECLMTYLDKNLESFYKELIDIFEDPLLTLKFKKLLYIKFPTSGNNIYAFKIEWINKSISSYTVSDSNDFENFSCLYFFMSEYVEIENKSSYSLSTNLYSIMQNHFLKSPGMCIARALEPDASDELYCFDNSFIEFCKRIHHTANDINEQIILFLEAFPSSKTIQYLKAELSKSKNSVVPRFKSTEIHKLFKEDNFNATWLTEI